MHDKRALSVREGKNGTTDEGFLEFGKGMLLSETPLPRRGFLEKVRQWRDNTRVIADKTLIEATEAKEATHMFGCGGGGPIVNCRKLRRLRANPVFVDNEATKIHGTEG